MSAAAIPGDFDQEEPSGVSLPDQSRFPYTPEHEKDAPRVESLFVRWESVGCLGENSGKPRAAAGRPSTIVAEKGAGIESMAELAEVTGRISCSRIAWIGRSRSSPWARTPAQSRLYPARTRRHPGSRCPAANVDRL